MGALNYDVAGSKPADKGVFALTLEVIADSQRQRAEREFVHQEQLAAQKFTQQRDSEIEPFGGW
jgi:hypothetical protein